VRVLVDTSVWSLALRKRGPADHPAVQKLTRLLDDGEGVVLTAILLQEILQAFPAESTFRRLVSYFEPFELLAANREEAVAAARLHRLCASRGIAASTADCAIAAVAMIADCPLLTTDRDFERIAEISALRLL